MEEQAAGNGFGVVQKPRRRARPREETVPALRLRASRRAVSRAPVEPPPASFLRPLLDFLGEASVDPDDLRNRDPEFIRTVVPWLDAVTSRYFRPEYAGVEHLPRSGPFIAVGNHNGGPMLPDLWTMLPFWAEQVGTDLPVYAMVHDVAFKVKVAGNFFARLGGLRACRRNAEKVLAGGAGLLVYPGGELDCFRSFWQRDTIDLQGRTGFVELAFEHGAPIIPFVNVGAHETCFTLLSSRTLARWTGLERLTRVKTLPVNLGLPWGLWVSGFVPFLPLPAKFAYRFGEPIPVPRDPDRARDPQAVRGVYRMVTGVMQDMLNELARRRWPLLG